MTDYDRGYADGSLAASMKLAQADYQPKCEYNRGWRAGYEDRRREDARQRFKDRKQH